MKKRSLQLLSILLVFTLLVGCGDAGNYVKENYTLVDVQGQGKSTAKIYSVEGKDVPTVAKEISDKEKPKETSKESADQMFLVYDNKIVNVQKDPNNENTSLVEVDSIEYAKQNYDSSFLQGYIAASLIQSVFGGGWSNSRGNDYRGYTSSKRYDDYGKYQTAPKTGGSTATSPTTTPTKPTPATTDRKGSFNSAPTTNSPSATTPPKSSSGSNSSTNTRKNDGSSSTYKSPSSSKSGSSSKPSTSTRSGSFKKK
ncbi:DUF4247 domain-containing protein [Paenibacillus radicis (ex Xue et al. 2023)]|uniref:DUF4247 domain-containing protein n=1 Tax=Paenibacillus radicis (ex Xue et al. 2023) TaxID=2972489 RepID=A0ABT1YEA7_9BACL|nr:DUF4247 domain-containing protein [Paenibacillus radicis (ex Xue et al. 2023)]MCR8631100.1 DUF4247 domain-containing protein [Paenibacillus radicis (ex Xue et al. 2023)]